MQKETSKNSLMTRLSCGVCKRQHRSAEAARICEAQGPAKIIPIGTLWAKAATRMTTIYVVVDTGNDVARLNNDHTVRQACFVFRDLRDGSVDSVGNSTGAGALERWSEMVEPRRDLAALERAIQALKERNINPLLWNGKAAVALSTLPPPAYPCVPSHRDSAC